MATKGKRPSSILISAAALTLAVTGCGGSGAGDDETIEWDLPMYNGLSNPVVKMTEEFASDVSERTDGRLKITVRPTGELPFAPDEMLRRVGDNSVAMGDALGAFVAGDCRIASAGTLPLVVRDAKDWPVAWEMLREPTQECFESFGAVSLATYGWPSQNPWGKGDAPQTMEDLNGRVIRQAGAETEALLSELGAETVSLTTPEVADALGRGVIDGAVTSAMTVVGNGWASSVDWGYVMDIATSPSFILVNKDELDALPADLREALIEAADAFEQKVLDELPKIEDEGRASLRDSGVTIVEASEDEVQQLQTAMMPYWDEWISEAEPEDQAALQAVIDAMNRL